MVPIIRFITYLTTFIIIILAELGDKTQVATLIYSSNHPAKRWQIFGAAAAALITCVTLEVTLGVFISKFISPSVINKITGIVFIIIGLYSLGSYIGERRVNKGSLCKLRSERVELDANKKEVVPE